MDIPGWEVYIHTRNQREWAKDSFTQLTSVIGLFLVSGLDLLLQCDHQIELTKYQVPKVKVTVTLSVVRPVRNKQDEQCRSMYGGELEAGKIWHWSDWTGLDWQIDIGADLCHSRPSCLPALCFPGLLSAVLLLLLLPPTVRNPTT